VFSVGDALVNLRSFAGPPRGADHQEIPGFPRTRTATGGGNRPSPDVSSNIIEKSAVGVLPPRTTQRF